MPTPPDDLPDAAPRPPLPERLWRWLREERVRYALSWLLAVGVAAGVLAVAWFIFNEPRRRDGNDIPVLIDLPAVRDPAGHLLYRIVTVFDITDRKRAHAIVFQFEQPISAIKGFFDNFRQVQGKRGGVQSARQAGRTTFAKLAKNVAANIRCVAHLVDR